MRLLCCVCRKKRNRKEAKTCGRKECVQKIMKKVFIKNYIRRQMKGPVSDTRFLVLKNWKVAPLPKQKRFYDKYKKHCMWCKKIFWTEDPKVKTCGVECGQKWNWVVQKTNRSIKYLKSMTL